MTDELDARRSRRRSWPWGVAIAAALIGLTTGRPFLEQTFPWLKGPAPDWMGLLVLAIPVVTGIVYVALRVRDARRRRRGWTAGAGRRSDGDGGCGGGGRGWRGGAPGGGGGGRRGWGGGGARGAGHGGCGGGSGCGGH